MLAALSKKFFVEYDPVNKRCKLVTGEAFAKPYLNSMMGYPEAYDLLQLACATIADGGDLSDEDKALLERAKAHVIQTQFKTYGAIYITVLLTVIHNDNPQFTRQFFITTFGRVAFDAAVDPLRETLSDYGLVQWDGKESAGGRGPAEIVTYGVVLDMSDIEQGLYNHMIHIFRDGKFSLPSTELQAVYPEMKALAANPQEPRRHLTFFRQSEEQTQISYALYNAQFTILKEVEKFATIPTSPNNIQTVIDMLGDIQRAIIATTETTIAATTNQIRDTDAQVRQTFQ